MAIPLEKLKKEYGDIFGELGTAPVISSELGTDPVYTAGLWEDYFKPAIEWMGDTIPGIGRSETSDPRYRAPLLERRAEEREAAEEYRRRAEEEMERLERETRAYGEKISDAAPTTAIPDEEFAKIVDREIGLEEIRKDPSGIAIKRTPSPGIGSFGEYKDAYKRGALRPVMPSVIIGEMTDAEIDELIEDELDLSKDDPLLSGYIPEDVSLTPEFLGISADTMVPIIRAPYTVTSGPMRGSFVDTSTPTAMPEFVRADEVAGLVASGEYKDPTKDTRVSSFFDTVPTLDERLDVPDVRTYTPAVDDFSSAGEAVSPSFWEDPIGVAGDSIIPLVDATGGEGPPPRPFIGGGMGPSSTLTDAAIMALTGGVGGVLGAAAAGGSRLLKAAKHLTGGRTTPKADYEDAMDITARSTLDKPLVGPGKVLGAPVAKRAGVTGALKTYFGRDVDLLASYGMGRSAREGLSEGALISDSVKKAVFSKVAKDLYGKATDATRRAVLATLRKELPDHDLSTPAKVTTYLTAMLKSGGGKVGEYKRTIDGIDSFADLGVRRAMTDVGKETFGGPMKRVVGLGGTAGALGGMLAGGASDAFADSPDYAYGEDVAPIIPVDDFSSIAPVAPPARAEDWFERVPGPHSDPRSPMLSYDFTGPDERITWTWPDGRVEVISEKMVEEGWERHTPAMRKARKEKEIRDAAVASALEKMATYDPYAPREITYIDLTGSATPSIFSGSEGVGDIGGSSGTVTSPLTGVGGFYAPITPHIPIGPGESALSGEYAGLGYGSDIYT